MVHCAWLTATDVNKSMTVLRYGTLLPVLSNFSHELFPGTSHVHAIVIQLIGVLSTSPANSSPARGARCADSGN
jgi:hypothetical protein